MTKISYKLILIVLLIITASLVLFYNDTTTTNIYLDGENASSSSFAIPFIHDTGSMDVEISEYCIKVMNDPNSNITTLKEGVEDICKSYGFNDITVNVDSSFGKNQIPVLFHVQGTSMLPTLQDGQTIILEKTKNISVGDIVVANDTNYGVIVKRVGDISGDQVYLQSDNKNVEIVEINGIVYEKKGLTTWTDLSNIYGVVKVY